MEQEKVLSFVEWFVERFDSGIQLQGIFIQDDLKACHEWTKQNEQNRIISEIEKLERTEAFEPVISAIIKIVKGEPK